MRVRAFAQKVGRYGQTATIYWKPDISEENKCSCWEDGYPDPDCANCSGEGYENDKEPTTVRAFVQDFKKRLGERVDDIALVDQGKMGRKRFYFDNRYNPIEMNYIKFIEKDYRVLEYGEWLIEDEIIYRWATCEVIN